MAKMTAGTTMCPARGDRVPTAGMTGPCPACGDSGDDEAVSGTQGAKI